MIQEKLWEFVPLGRHFSPMTQFFNDAATAGGLASYTFIEPNMLCSRKYGPENDMHPAFAITETGTATNVLYGEDLVYRIYKALREGPDWESTLFVITFDEHGGCYDHVPTPPPLTVAPDDLNSCRPSWFQWVQLQALWRARAGSAGLTLDRAGHCLQYRLRSYFDYQDSVKTLATWPAPNRTRQMRERR